MFSSNAMWATSGYGQQMFELLPRIAKEGYPTAIVNFYGLDGGRIVLDGITCYPKINDQWGADAVVQHQKHFKPDVVFTLQDIWVLNPQLLGQYKNWIPIVPIDHEPTPPAVRQRLNAAYRIVTYSKFGRDQLQEEGVHSTYIPHTVDTKLFKAVDKKEARKQMNLPEDVFMFGMVAANKDNPPRKSFQDVMDAFKKFTLKHPKSAIYFHTSMDQPKGFPIKEYAKTLGIANKIFHVDAYDLVYSIGREHMHKIYSAFDCLLMPSTNEGFGVPAVEAQACEVPVIVNNFSAMPELIIPDKTGYLCSERWRRFTPLLAFVSHPDPESIYDNMERVFSANREKMGKEARKHVIKNYDTDVVFEKRWKPFLDKLEKEIYTS